MTCWLQLDIEEMKSVSKRWEADLKSDSTLAKNVRPMSLIFLTLAIGLFIRCLKFRINLQAQH